jgi:hypothetical protein
MLLNKRALPSRCGHAQKKQLSLFAARVRERKEMRMGVYTPRPVMYACCILLVDRSHDIWYTSSFLCSGESEILLMSES